MPARLLTIFIIGFWAIMTGLLLQSIWFPADSRLTRLNPGAVFQLIAARGESSSLDIYDDRKIVGRLNVQTTRLRKEQRHDIKLRLSGRLQLKHALLDGVSLGLDANANLSHLGEVGEFKGTIMVGGEGPQIELTLDSPEATPAVKVTNKGATLFDSTVLANRELDSQPLVAMLLGMMGLSPKEFEAVQSQAAKQASQMVLEARQGEFDLVGQKRQGYVVTWGTPGKPGFRMCVENTGEIVLVETPTSYRLLTEALAPPPNDSLK